MPAHRSKRKRIGPNADAKHETPQAAASSTATCLERSVVVCPPAKRARGKCTLAPVRSVKGQQCQKLEKVSLCFHAVLGIEKQIKIAMKIAVNHFLEMGHENQRKQLYI